MSGTPSLLGITHSRFIRAALSKPELRCTSALSLVLIKHIYIPKVRFTFSYYFRMAMKRTYNKIPSSAGQI